MSTVSVKRTVVTKNGETTTTVEVTTTDNVSAEEALRQADAALVDVEFMEKGFAGLNTAFDNIFGSDAVFSRWPFKARKPPEPPKKT